MKLKNIFKRNTGVPKHRWIGDNVAGKTFADIGGLWGTLNETVSIAHKGGASKCTMVDIRTDDNKWWGLFHERCNELGVSGYDSVVDDICDADVSARLGTFDMVHCSGILYHVSDPLAMIRNLVSITNEYLIIGSMLVPEHISNSKGELHVNRGVLHSIPLMKANEKEIFGEHFSSLNIKVAGLNKPDFDYISPDNEFLTDPWWFLFTAETMVAMCEMFDLTIEESWITSQGAQNLVCRKNK